MNLFILGFLQFPWIFSRSFWKGFCTFIHCEFWHSWRVFHIKWFAWQKGIQLTDWYFTRGHTWRNYAGFGSKRWWWSYSRLYRTTRYSFFFICTVIWFDGSKWRYIRAKYTHALQTQLTRQFHFVIHFVRWQVIKQPYQITALSYHLCFFIIYWMDFCVVKNYAEWFTL